jgi:multidrug efflux pump
VQHTLGIAGQSFLTNANGSNLASMFVILNPFHERQSPELRDTAIADQLRQKLFREIEDAQVAVFGAPPVDGLGNAGGFRLMIEDRGDSSLPVLQEQTENLAEKGNKMPGLVDLFTLFRANTPQKFLAVNRTKCKTMGVALNDVFDALQVYLGGYYVNDFNQFGRTWQVNAQADASFRMQPQDVKQLKVRNAAGDMVPLGALVTIRDSSGPDSINRYNTYPAAALSGDWTPEMSSGQAIAKMQHLADRELPSSMAYEWTDLCYQEILAGNTALFIFPLCVLFVFLTHSAEYESWTLPLAIILIVPMSLLCALAGAALRGMDNNLFTQIGFVVLAGLACKNSVLIVEFAKQQHEHGMPRVAAAVEAARLRLRPIMMTSFAFILGVVPLMLASGAGAEMRQTLGTAVFSGMLGVTLFGIFLTPVFYCVLQGLSDWWAPPRPAAESNPD